MRIYFSNRNLWETISIILISSAVLFLFCALFFHNNIFLVFILLILAVMSTYGTFRISKQAQKIYLEIEKNTLSVHHFWKEEKQTIYFSDIKNLTKNGSNIVILCESISDLIIKLEYINADDSKKLISLLRYQPAIKKKNFFA